MPRASRERSCALSISRATHIHTGGSSYLCAFGDALLDASTFASTVSYAIPVRVFTRLVKIAHAHITVFAFCRVVSVCQGLPSVFSAWGIVYLQIGVCRTGENCG